MQCSFDGFSDSQYAYGMIANVIIVLSRLLVQLRNILKTQELRAKELEGYEKYTLKRKRRKSGKEYYYRKDGGKSHQKYLGNASDAEVRKIKEAHYLRKSIKVLRADIALIGAAVEGLRGVGYDDIEEMLPDVYRGAGIRNARSRNKRAADWKARAEAYKATFKPWKPEELKIRTRDGNLVRSKSEALIYNTLLDLGVTFVYELPLKVGDKTFYPDFTILSETDCKTTIIIEHQGKMNDDEYRNRFFEKLYDYWKAGYIQGINIFFTFDGPGGSLDMTPVTDVVDRYIRPAAMDFPAKSA